MIAALLHRITHEKNMFSAAAAREQMALSIEKNLGSRNAAVTIDEFNQLAASVEHHLDKCELRAAKAVVDSLARLLPEGSRSSAALHAVLSARVYRSIDDESSARMYAQQALSHLPLNLPAARNLRAIALSLLHKYQEAFAEHRKAHREATPAALPALEMAQGKPVLVTLFKLEHDIGQLAYLNQRGLLADSVPLDHITATYTSALEQMRSGCEQQARSINGSLPCEPFGAYQTLAPELRAAVEVLINQPYNEMPYSAWGEGAKAALNIGCCDWREVEREFMDGQVVVLDSLLTEVRGRGATPSPLGLLLEKLEPIRHRSLSESLLDYLLVQCRKPWMSYSASGWNRPTGIRSAQAATWAPSRMTALRPRSLQRWRWSWRGPRRACLRDTRS